MTPFGLEGLEPFNSAWHRAMRARGTMHRLGGWRAAPAQTLHCNTQTPGAVQEPPCTHSAYAHVPAQRARLAQQTHTQHWHWHKHAHPIGSHPTRGIGSHASRECAHSATAHANPNKTFTCGLLAMARRRYHFITCTW